MKIFLVVFVSYCVVNSVWGDDTRRPRIGVVGAGIGGSSCALFLRELFGEEAQIDVYERSEVGGRMATVEIGGRHYESGGSIIHPTNLYMKNFTTYLGLRERDRAEGRLALYNGEELVFDGSKYEILTVLQLFYQYGFDLVRINRFVKNVMTNFEKIYPHQSAGHAFTTVERLLSSMDPALVRLTRQTTEQALTDWGIGRDFIDQLVTAGLRTNYGQGADIHAFVEQRLTDWGIGRDFIDQLVTAGLRTNCRQGADIHAFVGGVSMAGLDPGLWSVEGGNKRIPNDLLNVSRSNIIHSKVTKVTLLENQEENGLNHKYRVTSDTDGVLQAQEYHFVIIAAPMYDNLTQIYFEGFPYAIVDTSSYNMHRTVATFIQGIPNAPKFNVHNIYNFPDSLLTTNTDLFFSSMGRHAPVDWSRAEGEKLKGNHRKQLQKAVYKVFSREPLTEEQIKELFLTQEEVKVIDWMAYPKYESSKRNAVNKFELFGGLYYINAIETAASVMEMSVIGGKNAALLAYNTWNGKTREFTDNEEITGGVDNEEKTEL